jgi:hypothetical protein
MTTTESTIHEHRLSGNWNPKKYTYATSFNWNMINTSAGSFAIDPIPGDIVEKLEESGFSIFHCTHCGSALSKGNIFAHENGDYAIFGETCTKRLDFECADDLKELHVENAIRNAHLRKAMLEDETLVPIIENLRKIAENEEGRHTLWSVNTAKDLLKYLGRNFGFASEKHRSFAANLPEIAENSIKREEAYAAKVEERKRKDAESKWIGTEGERREWVLTRVKSLEYEGHYGLFFVHLYRDEDSNLVIYKGSATLSEDKAGNEIGEKGDGTGRPITARIVATVKGHDERDGVKSTIIARPKIVEAIPGVDHS